MTNGPTLTPRLLGRAENAHRAVLGRILGASDMTYHEWVALTLASAADSTVARNQLAGRMVGALNIDRATARGAIDRLIGAELLEPDEPSHLRLSDAAGSAMAGSARQSTRPSPDLMRTSQLKTWRRLGES